MHAPSLVLARKGKLLIRLLWIREPVSSCAFSPSFRTQICSNQCLLRPQLQNDFRDFSTSLPMLRNMNRPKEADNKRKVAGISSTKANATNEELLMEEYDDDDSDSDEEEGDDSGRKRRGNKPKASPTVLASKALREMEEYFKVLSESLVKHLSLSVNLKVYEELAVILENGESHKLLKFARITMKSPRGPIVLNFTDNPTAVTPAKKAILNMAENVKPQQDGLMLYVPIPKITRERREELAKKSANLIFNEYKTALNEVYGKYVKLIEKSTSDRELLTRLTNTLLIEKQRHDKMGEDKVKERRELLLKEIELG